jgi:hypothetical protein
MAAIMHENYAFFIIISNDENIVNGGMEFLVEI